MYDVKVSVDFTAGDNLKKSLVNKIMRKAITEASKPTREAIKANANSYRRYGFYAKSVAVKIKTYPTGVVAIMGARSKAIYTKNGKRIRPAYYAHFLEGGTSRIAKRPVLKPALDGTKQAYIHRVTELMGQGIEQELSKKA